MMKVVILVAIVLSPFVVFASCYESYRMSLSGVDANNKSNALIIGIVLLSLSVTAFAYSQFFVYERSFEIIERSFFEKLLFALSPLMSIVQGIFVTELLPQKMKRYERLFAYGTFALSFSLHLPLLLAQLFIFFTATFGPFKIGL